MQRAYSTYAPCIKGYGDTQGLLTTEHSAHIMIIYYAYHKCRSNAMTSGTGKSKKITSLPPEVADTKGVG
jgi:hypothetical protein